MTKIKLITNSQHQSGIVEVDPRQVEYYLSLGCRLIDDVGFTIPEDLLNGGLLIPQGLLDGKFTEKQIKSWLEENKINIKYDITNDEKTDVINRIKKHFNL